MILCGLDYKDIVNVACEQLTFQASAARLGVSESRLRDVLKARGMGHWFKHNGVTRHRGYSCPVTMEDLELVAGMTKKDAASVLKYAPKHFGQIVKQLKCQHLFPNRAKARWLSERGYAA